MEIDRGVVGIVCTLNSRADKLLSRDVYVHAGAYGARCRYVAEANGGARKARPYARCAPLKRGPAAYNRRRQSDVEHRHLMSFRALLDGLFTSVSLSRREEEDTRAACIPSTRRRY